MSSKIGGSGPLKAIKRIFSGGPGPKAGEAAPGSSGNVAKDSSSLKSQYGAYDGEATQLAGPRGGGSGVLGLKPEDEEIGPVAGGRGGGGGTGGRSIRDGAHEGPTILAGGRPKGGGVGGYRPEEEEIKPTIVAGGRGGGGGTGGYSEPPPETGMA
jgi:hypothetical protein